MSYLYMYYAEYEELNLIFFPPQELLNKFALLYVFLLKPVEASFLSNIPTEKENVERTVFLVI